MGKQCIPFSWNTVYSIQRSASDLAIRKSGMRIFWSLFDMTNWTDVRYPNGVISCANDPYLANVVALIGGWGESTNNSQHIGYPYLPHIKILKQVLCQMEWSEKFLDSIGLFRNIILILHACKFPWQSHLHSFVTQNTMLQQSAWTCFREYNFSRVCSCAIEVYTGVRPMAKFIN